MRIHSTGTALPFQNDPSNKMSLSREAQREGRDYLKENCAQFFGQRFFDSRIVAACQLCHKSDKFETRFVAICKYRVFVVHGKTPVNFKLERSFNILNLRQLQVHENEVSIFIISLIFR